MDSTIAVWPIGPYWQQGNLWFERLADVGEAIEVCRIAGVVEGMATTPNHVATEAPVRVLEKARPPVLGGRHRDLQAAHGLGLPPLQRDHSGETHVVHQVFYSPGHHGDGGPAGYYDVVCDNTAKGG